MTAKTHHRRATAQEREQFEQLVTLRRRYAERGDEDRTSVMHIRHAIAVARAAMSASSPRLPIVRVGIRGT